MKNLARSLVAAFALAAAGGAGLVAQRSQLPSLALESTTGRDSFAFYCASCHGANGRGEGPTSVTLRVRPGDLTTLAQRNGGAFPRQRVLETISGTAQRPAAHGSSEMPVWGPIFRSLDPSAARNDQRLLNLVEHVASIQRATTAPGDVGATLFRTHCASCHGSTGRGNGPVADQLRAVTPDLTKYTFRNGGVFPRERVYQIVDGRHIPAHGIPEMPVWGDVFRQLPQAPTDAAVRARIEAIVGYLEAIQERPAE